MRLGTPPVNSQMVLEVESKSFSALLPADFNPPIASLTIFGFRFQESKKSFASESESKRESRSNLGITKSPSAVFVIEYPLYELEG